MTVATPPQHGTRARYAHSEPELRCRCAACVKANRDYQRAYRNAPATPRLTVCPTCRRLHTVAAMSTEHTPASS